MRTKRDIVTDYLVVHAQAGSTDALNRLVRLWAPPLQSFVHRQTGARQDLDDIMQDVWVAVSRGIGRLEDPARFKHWAYRIARNKSVDWIRRRQSSRKMFEEEEDADSRPAEHDAAASVVHATLQHELARMPAPKRQLLVLFYLEEFSIRDIARVLGIPEGTVKSRLFHARQELKRTLEDIS